MHRSSLNHNYRLVWSALHSAFVAVAENVRGKGKSSSTGSVVVENSQPISQQTQSLQTKLVKFNAVALAVAVMSYGSLATAELPTGGVINSGSATYAVNGNNLDITQTSSKVYSTWDTFNIGGANAVNIAQPSSSAIFLANILDANVTKIQGQLNANGQVFLINPNGILFSPTAQINVGGLVASTLNLSQADFNAGNYNFAGASSNAIINQGNIISANGGTVALIAGKITNTGTIVANAGNVLFGAGSKVTLDLGGPVKLQVEQGAIDALINNGGAIKADGGYIYLTAKAANDLATTVINNTGLIEAQTLETGEKGEIYLMGDMEKGIVEVGGIINSSAPNGGDGGFIETSAATVIVSDSAVVTTKSELGNSGTWLIDPLDYYIAATGGNMTGVAVSSALQNNGNFTIQTTNNSGTQNGDIFVNDTISWTNNSTLTLNAFRNIEINQTITSTGSSGKLVLQYGQGAATSGNAAQYFINAKVNLANGQNFSTKIGNTTNGNSNTQGITNFTVINSLSSLSTSGSNSGNYALGADVVLSGNFTKRAQLTGTFEGLGHTISNLIIDTNSNDVGLFSSSSGTIRNVGILSGSVEGDDRVGALVGSNSGTIFNSYATIAVSGEEKVGGLVGRNSGSISNSYATGNISTTGGDRDEIGGLVGENTGTITGSYARGNVNGSTSDSDRVGGLVGYNNEGVINTSLATGNVTGNDFVGGLVGENRKNNNGNNLSGSISDSYAIGNVTGDDKVGGLVGYNNDGNIYRTYSTGRVVGDDDVGGLVGDSTSRNNQNRRGVIDNSYWDTQTSQRSTSDGGTGRTTAQMQQQATFNGWDFVNTWFITSGNSPFLRGIKGGEVTTITIGDFTKTYDGVAFNSANVITGNALIPSNTIFTFTLSGGTDPLTSALNAGEYVIVGPISAAPVNQFGSYVQYISGSLTIAKREISLINLTADNKVYDGNTNATFSNGMLNNVVPSESITLGAVTGTFADQNAANGINVTFDNAVLNYGDGVLASNYEFIDPTGLFSADITKRDTTVSGITANNKIYDGNTNAVVNFSNAIFSNLVDGESISIDSVTGNFVNANAGNNKIVNLTNATYSSDDLRNYNVTDQTTTRATINKASLTVIADDKSKTYGDNNPNFTVSYDGFVNGENFATSDLRGTVVAGINPALALLNKNLDAGEYTIGLLPLLLRSNNYDISYQTGVLTVNKALVTVTGGTYVNTYGDGLPTLGVTYDGFKNGQNVNSRTLLGFGPKIVSGNVNLTTDATNQPDAGNYVVDVTGSLNAKNYNFEYVDGSLTVNKAQLTVTFDNQKVTYGDLFLPVFTDVTYGEFQYQDTSADLQGTAVGVANASFLSNAGNYAINRSRLLNTLRSDNYEINYVSGVLEIEKANLYVDVKDQTRQYGDANQAFQYTYSGFKNLDSVLLRSTLRNNVAYKTEADHLSNVGTYDISANTATQAFTLRNYNLIFGTGELNVTPREITVTGNNASKAFGALDPVFGYVVGGRGMVNGDTLQGLLSRLSGELPGNYLISNNGLFNNNYVITDFTAGTLAIDGFTEFQNNAVTNAQNLDKKGDSAPSDSVVNYVDVENAPPAAGEGNEGNVNSGVNIFFVGNGVSGPN